MKNKVWGISSVVFVLILNIGAYAQGDFKIKQRMTMGGRASESTLMIKGARERSESSTAGIQTVSVMECDMKRTVYISDADKKYFIEPMASPVTTTAAPAAPVKTTAKVKTEKGGTVTRTIEIIDTGERQQMFGMTARHIKTIVSTEPSADACEKDKQRIETDGWYVDLAVGLSCKTDRPPVNPMDLGSDSGGCRDQQKVVQKGTGKLGYALKVTTKISLGDDDGETDPQMAAMMTMTTEVLELSKATLPQSLFEIPEGYTEATKRQDLYGRGTQKAQSDYAKSAPAYNDMPTVSTPKPSGAKRPGVVRIGVMALSNSSGKPLNLNTYQSMLVMQLAGDKVDAVAISSESEAKTMNCDYILTTDIKSIKQSAAGKIGGMFGKVTGAPTSGGKVESIIAYGLKGLSSSASASLQAEATAKVEGDENSIMAAVGNEVQAVMKAVKK
jgi:hypothetical protein